MTPLSTRKKQSEPSINSQQWESTDNSDVSNISDIFDKKMLDKYNTTGPRYTSYPTAVSFHQNFTEADFALSVEKFHA